MPVYYILESVIINGWLLLSIIFHVPTNNIKSSIINYILQMKHNIVFYLYISF